MVILTLHVSTLVNTSQQTPSGMKEGEPLQSHRNIKKYDDYPTRYATGDPGKHAFCLIKSGAIDGP